MKKFALSASVVVAFFLYSLFVRQQNQTDAVLSPTPTSASPTPGQSSFSSDTPTTPPTTDAPAAASPTPIPTTPPAPRGRYKDGSYTGDPADAFYGTIQVRATVTNGTLTDVTFLQYPNDRGTSIYINGQAMPMLRQEAITAQSGNVDIISGATDSSRAFVQSLTSALAKAQ